MKKEEIVFCKVVDLRVNKPSHCPEYSCDQCPELKKKQLKEKPIELSQTIKKEKTSSPKEEILKSSQTPKEQKNNNERMESSKNTQRIKKGRKRLSGWNQTISTQNVLSLIAFLGAIQILTQDNYDFPYLDDEEFNKVGKTLKAIKIKEETKAQLQDSIRKYFTYKDWHDNTPRNAKIRTELINLRDKSQALIDCLKELSEKSINLLIDYNPFLFPQAELFDTVDNISEFKKIFDAIQVVLEKLEPDTGGPVKTKLPLRIFIINLKGIFEEVTGKGATITWSEINQNYQGHFFRFVEELLEIIAPEEIWSNASLGKQIERALRTTKNNLKDRTRL
jgi:hypothetical protein